MDVEDRGAGVVRQNGVEMCGAIIEKLRGACRLDGGEGAKGNKHG
jgi:hypothetical protein